MFGARSTPPSKSLATKRPVETTVTPAVTPAVTTAKKQKTETLDVYCHCGNKFLDDSRFCRRCGAPRGSTAPSTAPVEEPDVFCSCGNKFMPDSKFCRKCGAPRQKNRKNDESEREQIAKLCIATKRNLQASVDKAAAEHGRGKRHAADGDLDHKTKVKQHKKVVDDVADAKRQVQAAEERVGKAGQQLANAEADHAQKKDIFDAAQQDLDDADVAYKQHFLPLKGTSKASDGLPWAESAVHHMNVLTPILQEENCEDCLLAGFKEATTCPPQGRANFCISTINEVDKILQKYLNKKKNAVNAATPPFNDARAKLKEANDANDRAVDNEKRAVNCLAAAEDAEQKAKPAIDAAEEELRRRNDHVIFCEKDHDDKKVDVDNFRKLEKELLDAEADVDDILRKRDVLEGAKRAAQLRKNGTSKDVDRAKDALTEAQKKCAQARAEAEKARAAADAAKARLDDAIAESNDFDDMYTKHFVPVKNGKFKDINEVHRHLDVLRPVLTQLDIEPCLLAGFDAASCHTKEERGPFCTKVVEEVCRSAERHGQKLRDIVAKLRTPYEKADAEVKRLGALQERACGVGVQEAEADVDRRMAADDEAAKALDKASAALDEYAGDVADKVQIRDNKLSEAKAFSSAVGA